MTYDEWVIDVDTNNEIQEYKIESIRTNALLQQQAKDFLQQIDSVIEIDEELIENGVVILTDDVVGYITYEVYSEYGLIRYFIFQKQIDANYVYQMFQALVGVAKQDGIQSFISIGKNKEVIELFENLGFYPLEHTDFLINGQKIIGTELEYATILKYDMHE